CTSSAGIASNILLAKLALKNAKPNGQHYLPDNQTLVNKFIQGLSVKELPGIGYSTNNKLKEIFNVVTCGDLQNISLESLKREFGEKSGKNIYDHCRGIDRSVLKIYQTRSRKSVSAVVNYGIRFTESSEVHRFMLDLAKEVSDRLDAINAKGKLITLKVLTRSKDAPVQTLKFLGCGMCDSVCKSTTLRTATNSATVIGNEAIAMLKGIKHHVPDLRGIGLQIGKLEFSVSVPTSSVNLQPNSHKNLLHYFNSNQTGVNEDTVSVNDNSQPALQLNDILPVHSNSSVSPISTNSVQLEAADQQLQSSVASFPDSFAMIDKDVLNALPEYMRREVLSNYNISVSSDTPKNAKQSKKGKNKKSPKTVTANNRTREGPLDKMIKNIASGKANLNVLPAHLSNVAHICGQTDEHKILLLI
ncbi:DNA repair protein REV1-like protein, partial [Leptotrombidium deliense]